MKKIIIFMLIFMLISVNASAYIYVEDTVNEDFSVLLRYGIHNIDTNGEVYAGVLNDTLVTSTDFDYWQRNPEITGIGDVKYLNGKFCAYGGGFTYVSADGINWERQENNLPGYPGDYYIIKNNGSVVTFVYNEGTYQSYDAINWKRVENIPDGISMNIINGKIMFSSDNYMRGLYYSDTGESFTHVEIPEYTDMYQIRYENGEYLLDDHRASSEDEEYYTVYYSTDLVNWNTRQELREGSYYRYGSSVTINGEPVVFALDGIGKYNMRDGKNQTSHFVYYNFTDYGVFAWSISNYSYFVKNNGTMLTYDGQNMALTDVFVKDNMFYATAKNGDLLKSETGESWVKTDEVIEKPSSIMNSGSNGICTLTSNYAEHGDNNEEITAEIKYPVGKTKRVAYEYTTKDDYVRVIGGNGYFLLGFEAEGNWYYSRDGITREQEIGLGIASDNGYGGVTTMSNGNGFLTFYENTSSIRYGEMSQFENIGGAEKNVLVSLNGEYLSFATPPIIQEDRTLIPIRFLFERAGAEVLWDEVGYSVTITYADTTIKLAIDDDTAYVNGEPIKLDISAQLINDKTMIPLRFISEELGFNVVWNEDGYTAEISTDKANNLKSINVTDK